MPGSFKSTFIVAFDLDERGQAIQAFLPKQAPNEAAGLADAKVFLQRHAGVIVWKREGDPVVGEEGEPVILFQSGAIGDFN
jgi:hypothetical protein